MTSRDGDLRKAALQLNPSKSIAQTYNINIPLSFFGLGIQVSKGNVYEQSGNVVPISSIALTFSSPQIGLETNTFLINGNANDHVGYAFGVEYITPGFLAPYPKLNVG